jgi:NAD(P)H dehydrogenase (quinone)
MQTVKLLVLYYSRHGATHQLAELIAEGIESVNGANAILRTVPSVSATTQAVESEIPKSGPPYAEHSDLANCDGLALGSPTRFGNMAAAMKYFLDGSSGQWLQGSLTGKPACVFTSSSSMHGGQESTLLTMMIPLFHHGMLLMGLPYTLPELHHTTSGGTPYGISHVAGSDNQFAISKEERILALAQGQQLAKYAQLLKQEKQS